MHGCLYNYKMITTYLVQACEVSCKIQLWTCNYLTWLAILSYHDKNKKILCNEGRKIVDVFGDKMYSLKCEES